MALGDTIIRSREDKELVQRLVEYRQFKEAAGQLKLKEDERRLLFGRGMVPAEDEAGPLPLAPATLFDLLDALNRVLARVPEPTIYEVQAESFAVEDKMELLTVTLRRRGRMSFEELLAGCRTRAEMVVTFIALLEIIKLDRIFEVYPDAASAAAKAARTTHPAREESSSLASGIAMWEIKDCAFGRAIE